MLGLITSPADLLQAVLAAADRLASTPGVTNRDMPRGSAQVSSVVSTRRLMVGIAGAPASGKSTLAAKLAASLSAALTPRRAVVLPMDGYHLDDAILVPAGLRPVKGSPHTFDVGGLLSVLQRVHAGESPVYLPRFDRQLELSRNAAVCVDDSVSVVVVEGNYLLLDDPLWHPVAALLDLSISLYVEMAELERRLLQRWRDHGLEESEIRHRTEANDLPNARLIVRGSRPADLQYRASD